MAQALGFMILAATLWAVFHGIGLLLKSKTEAARRARIVLGSLLALAVGWVWFMMTGPIGLGIALAGIGAVAWIVRGNKS